MRRLSAIGIVALTATGAVAAAIVMSGRSHAHDTGDTARTADDVASNVASRSGTPKDQLARGMLDRSSLRKRDDFITPDGERFTISEGQTQDGAKTCVVSAGRGFAGSACAANPFATSTVLFGESFSAGPGGKDLTEWELSGLAAPQVARLELIDSAGRHRPVHLGKGNAFFFAFSRGEVKRGIAPQSLQVFDADGRLIDTVAL